MTLSIIGNQNFQEFNIYDSRIAIRYRIVSEDQNNRSYWSPIYKIDPNLAFIPGNRTNYGKIFGYKNSNSSFFQLSWDSVSTWKDDIGLDAGRLFPALAGNLIPKPSFIADLQDYDVWIRWSDNGDANKSPWIYKERISTTSLSVPDVSYKPEEFSVPATSPKFARAEVYRPGKPIKRYSPDILEIDSTTTTNILNAMYFQNPHGINKPFNILYYSSFDSGNLISGSAYWIAPLSLNSIAFYANSTDAQADQNRIVLPGSSQLSSGEIILKTFTQNSSSVLVGSNQITMPGHGFSSGDGIVYRSPSPITGIVDEQLLWVRVMSSSSFFVYEDYFQTRDFNFASLPLFSATGSGLGSFSRYPFLIYKTKIAL